MRAEGTGREEGSALGGCASGVCLVERGEELAGLPEIGRGAGRAGLSFGFGLGWVFLGFWVLFFSLPFFFFKQTQTK